MGLMLNLTCLAVLGVIAYVLGRQRALKLVNGDTRALHSLPGHYGAYVLFWTMVPGILVLVLGLGFGDYMAESRAFSQVQAENPGLASEQLIERFDNIKQSVAGNIVVDRTNDVLVAEMGLLEAAQQSVASLISWLTLGGAAICMAIGFWMVRPDLRARNNVDKTVQVTLVIASAAAILVTVGIILSLIFETIRFFALVPVAEFFFGLEWSPQIALRADQVASDGSFGAVPLFAGTLLITFIAMCVAVPIGLMSAIYMTQYSSERFRSIAKPALEILAGVPTVVYGFFAALFLAPRVRELGEGLGLNVASESALAAGLVMGIMIIPFMSSLSDDALSAVPRAMKEGAFALGATKAETIRNVLIPAALPGIAGSFLLAVSRAIGETMIVVMAAGLAANLTANPLNAVTTVTVQIVTLLTGDQEFDSAKTLAAFALGLALFVITLGLNMIALRIVRKYREQYE